MDRHGFREIQKKLKLTNRDVWSIPKAMVRFLRTLLSAQRDSVDYSKCQNDPVFFCEDVPSETLTEAIYRSGYNKGYSSGRKEGRLDAVENYTTGHDEGYDEGYSVGLENKHLAAAKAYCRGHQSGFIEGEHRTGFIEGEQK